MAVWKKVLIMPNLYSRLDGKLRCEVCGRPLDVGEHAWSHMCPRKGDSYTVYYCVLCYTRLWI